MPLSTVSIAQLFAAGKIHISEETKELLDKDGAFKIEERGITDIMVRALLSMKTINLVDASLPQYLSDERRGHDLLAD